MFDEYTSVVNNQKHPVVFDCGANVGQTTSDYLRRFPKAEIYAFEPSPLVLPELHKTHGRNP